MSIKYPEVKLIKQDKKNIEEVEETNCHICNTITYLRCDLCGKCACSEHSSGVWRKIGNMKGDMVDICDTCLGKGL